MPLYLFQNKKTKKIVEVFFNMNDEKNYAGPNNDKPDLWERVWDVGIQAQVKENWDINNPKDFVHKTKHSKGAIGDLADRAQEFSEKRASQTDTGRDPVKDKMFDRWSKKRGGKKHPEDNRGNKTEVNL